MKENPLQYRVRGTPVPTTRTRGTNYPESTFNRNLDVEFSRQVSAYERCACPNFVHPAVLLAFFGFIAIQVILDQQ